MPETNPTPTLQEVLQDFDHYLSKVNHNKSFYDSRAIIFLNTHSDTLRALYAERAAALQEVSRLRTALSVYAPNYEL